MGEVKGERMIGKTNEQKELSDIHNLTIDSFKNFTPLGASMWNISKKCRCGHYLQKHDRCIYEGCKFDLCNYCECDDFKEKLA